MESGSDIEFEEEEEYEDDDDREYDEDALEDDDKGELEGELVEEEADEVQELPQNNAPYIRGLEPLRQATGRSTVPRQAATEEWSGLQSMPGPTQQACKELLDKLRADKKSQITILLLGKDGVGKTSLVNALLNESAVPVSYGQQQRPPIKPRSVSRTAAGFTLTLIDTPGVPEDGSNVELMLKATVASELKSKAVDVVLYLDRLDAYRVDSADRQIMEAISAELGPAFWNKAVIVFSHGRLTALPDGLSYSDYVHQRSLSVRSAIRKASGNRSAQLPAVAVENGWKCDKDDDKVRVLPDGTRWLTNLLEQIGNVAHQGSWKFDTAKRQNPDRRNRKWIPLILAAQLAFKFLVLDRVLEEDSISGDQWGPYDDKVVRLERRRRSQAKEAEKAARDAARSTRSGRRTAQVIDDDEDYDEDF